MEDNKKINVGDFRKLIRQIRETCIDYISSCVKDTDEEHPLKCDIVIGEESAYALSSLELPLITAIYKKGNSVYICIDGDCIDLDVDFIEAYDLLTIVEELQK